ncbi:MAG: hypothetical protein V2I82_11000 [Halieaceae bacterium]|jgi:hypothetical protein|nr:hypothetical protein [Halieaceae bacterium]
MTSIDSERFDVFFAGECLEGADPGDVREALGRLFRADEATLQRLFSGRRYRIKADVDAATAKRYDAAMRAAGAQPIVAAAEASKDNPEAAQDQHPSPSNSPPGTPPSNPPNNLPNEPPNSPPLPSDGAAALAAFDLAPAGADLLRDEERQRTEHHAPSTEHLSIAEPGANLGAQSAPTATSVSAPDFEIAEVGSVLSTAGRGPEPPAPDTSAISLDGPDYDLSDCAPDPTEPPALSLDHLALAFPGSALLDESERHQEAATVPDTSYLSLSSDGPIFGPRDGDG